VQASKNTLVGTGASASRGSERGFCSCFVKSALFFLSEITPPCTSFFKLVIDIDELCLIFPPQQ
jgi:hypothetical protein